MARPPDTGQPRRLRVEFRISEAELGEVTDALAPRQTVSDYFRTAGLERARSQGSGSEGDASDGVSPVVKPPPAGKR